MNTIIGQDRAVAVLQRSLNDHRVHHAWIFAGSRGIGKYTTAIKFAQCILQIDSDRIASHPDLHVIRKEDVVWSNNPALQRKKQTNIPVDLLRERMIGGKTSDDKNHDSIAFKTPVLARQKVFIIDEAELLDETAQNILLKTLEEPPSGTTIILVTSRNDLLLPTIRSRCLQIDFSPLDTQSMQLWAKKAMPDIAPTDLSWAIQFSDGSPGLVCEAIDSELPRLFDYATDFLLRAECFDYTKFSTKIAAFIDLYIEKKLKQNPLASKEAVNRSGMELVLKMFGSAARIMIRGNRSKEGVIAASIINDIERQLTTNISIKVLLESLTARWSYLCVGDSAFTPI